MVIIFCGVPGSGKSTIARILTERLRKLGKVRILIKEKPDKAYNGFRAIYGVHYYRQFPELLKEHLGKTDWIIMDATFHEKKWREMVKDIVGEKNVFTIYLFCSLKTCLERTEEKRTEEAKEKGIYLPERAIDIINRKMEKPEKPDISIDTEEVGPEEAVGKILNKLERRLK